MPTPKTGSRRKVTKLAAHRSRDVNQMAAAAIRRTLELTGELPEKNPAAVALGKLGGPKGGKARMALLTPAERRKLAAKAAKARWASKAKPTS